MDSEDNHQEENMEIAVYDYFSFGCVLLETIIGTLMNGFIVTVNLRDLITHGHLNSLDAILTCLGISRFAFQWLVITLYTLSTFFKSSGYLDDVISNIQYTWLFFSNITLWFATWLCMLYCVRIVNTKHRIFTLFKNRFDRLVPWFLITSVIISTGFSNPYAYDSINSFGNFSQAAKNNNSASFFLSDKNSTAFSILSVIGSIFPFLIFCITTLLVIGSLLKHTRKMKGQERTGFREPSLKAHYSAVKIMALFLLFYTLYIAAFYVYLSETVQSDLWNCLCKIMIGAYPSIHSTYLVHGISKLRHEAIKLLQKTRCYDLDLNQSQTVTM
ncbi:taste receptor type 2 member 40-like [Pelodytes ibericus]